MKKRLYQCFLIFMLILGLVVIRGINAMPKPAAELGVVDGRLAECPSKPNCVHSQVADGPPAIAPLAFSSTPQVAWKTLRAVVDAMPRTTIVTEQDDYLHCEFRTAIMRYVDDVEFLLDAENGKIDFRSASRVGYSDMGVNRKRMEEVRKGFEAALK